MKFRVPANITNVYFSVAAEVVGNNFTGTAGINTQLYDITECHKTITAGDLQPDGRCGISYLDARGMSAMNGSIGHIRLPAGRNYILVLTNPADGPVQVSRSAYITYTYLQLLIFLLHKRGWDIIYVTIFILFFCLISSIACVLSQRISISLKQQQQPQ